MRMPTSTIAEEMWNETKSIIYIAIYTIAMGTEPGKRFINLDNWPWDDAISFVKRHPIKKFIRIQIMKRRNLSLLTDYEDLAMS